MDKRTILRINRHNEDIAYGILIAVILFLICL